jgi:hypothetical protein
VAFDDGEYYFEESVKESGYGVIHIVIFQSESKDSVISTLNEFGCVLNTHVAYNYLVISIPPTVLYHLIQAYLFEEESKANISFRES